MACEGDLFAEDFFDVADFFLDLAAGLFRRSTILHVTVAGRSPCSLFYRAFDFLRRAFDFVFRARFHTRESRVMTLKDGGSKV
jgi:hypothetical protein